MNINLCKVVMLISLGVFLVPTRAFPNGATVGAEGGLIVPIQNDDVKLVSEKVVVDLSGYGGKAECVFRLRNLTNRELSFKMGFPFEGGPQEWVRYLSKEFKVYSTQKELPTEEIVQSTDTLYQPFRVLRIWSMYFPPGAERIVRCTYKAAFYMGDAPVGDLFGYGTAGFDYITKTGALWKGKIDTADFKIVLPYSVDSLYDSISRRIVTIGPGNHVWKGNIVSWHFENWKPDENIYIRERTYFLDELDRFFKSNLIDKLREASGWIRQYRHDGDYQGGLRLYTEKDAVCENVWPTQEEMQLTGKESAQAVELLKRLCVAYYRNEILARHGYRFKDPNWQQLFSEEKWYKPQDHFSLSLLNDIETKNLDFLSQYEKKRGWR